MLITLSSGASEAGLSYHGKVIDCPEQARLEEVAAQAAGGRRLGSGKQNGKGPDRGTAFHALVEAWAKVGGSDAEAAEIADADFGPADHPVLQHPAAIAEARRLFRYWTSLFAPNGWGRVSPVGPEVALASPQLATELGALRSPLTARLDLPVVMAEADCERLRPYCPGLAPGPWIVDYKVVAQNSGFGKYLHGMQRHLYPLLWDASDLGLVHGPALGVVFVFVIATITPKIRAFARYRAPDPEAKAVLRAFFNEARHARDVIKIRPSNCVDAFDGECPFLNSACARHLEEP